MMGDACICVDVEGEYIEWDERKVSSGAAQKCTECERTIPPGAPHVHHLGLTEPEYDDDDAAEGEWEELHRECLCCAAVRSSLFECGWFVGQVWSLLRDHMDEVMPIYDDDDRDESWCDPPTKPIGPGGW